jgi:hypothetical protein
MKISEMKQSLAGLAAVNFKLPDGTSLPPHFHVTEVGLVTKHFIDCGGIERRETVANFQLWEAGDYDHRLAPQKFLHILQLSEKILGSEDLELTTKKTACLAQDACGIPDAFMVLPQLATACCTPGGGCC